MLKMRVIPCLDVKDGRVVKGVNFVDLVDAGDPVEQAKIYDREGADELCFLDITASAEDRATLYDVVARTAEQCFMPLTVGGGVRSVEDIRRLLLAGADKASINTAAVARPAFVKEAAEKFGSQCIVVAIHRAHPRRRRRHHRPRHRLGRRRHARPSRRGHPRRPCHRRARRLDLPFRHLPRRPGEDASRRRGNRRAAVNRRLALAVTGRR